MRKISVLAAAVFASLAMLATVAAPAQADKEFWITDASGNYCNPICTDTGFEGSMSFHNQFKQTVGTCDVSYDMEIELEGALELTNVEMSNCTYQMASAHACSWEPWPGQLRIPDSGPAEVDVTTCIQGSASPPIYYDLTYQVTSVEGYRVWTQKAPSPYHQYFLIDSSEFTDINKSDNVKVVFEL